MSRNILGIDTSTPRGSVALLCESDLVAELRIHSMETHSARLLRSIRFLLESAGWRLKDLDLIAAGIGPGSFTGIRIGLSTALGLAQTLSAPFCGVNGFDALALKVTCLDGNLGVVLDAQRSQVYYAEYVQNCGEVKKVGRPGLYFPSDLRSIIAQRQISLVGDGVARFREELESFGNPRMVLLKTDQYLATWIGRLALTRKRYWRTGAQLRCDPLYIRPPDARKPKGRR